MIIAASSVKYEVGGDVAFGLLILDVSVVTEASLDWDPPVALKLRLCLLLRLSLLARGLLQEVRLSLLRILPMAFIFVCCDMKGRK